MIYRKTQNGYLLRLERGEKLVEKLIAFTSEHDVSAAWVTGLGGAAWAELGIYRLDTDKEYHFTKFEGPLEIISLTGNLSLVEGRPFPHLHANISGADLKSFGGHVKEMEIGGTCEIRLDVYEYPFERELDEEIGLKLLDL